MIAQEFEYCYHCGHFVGEHCPSCHRRVEGQWGFCPTCGTAAKRSAAESAKHDGRKHAFAREKPPTELRRAS